MKMKNLILAMFCLLLVPFVSGTVTHSGVLPVDLHMTQSTSIDFKWNLTSTLDDVLTTYLYITNQSDENQFLLNATNSSCVNDTQCGLTVTGLNEGFYQWNLSSTDDNGTTNISTSARWFEIRSVANESYFNWKNDSGFVAMTLNKNTGELWTAGNITSVFEWAVNTAYFGWNGSYLDWVFGAIYSQVAIEGMNDTLTAEDTALGIRITGVNDSFLAQNDTNYLEFVEVGDSAGGDLGGTYPNPTVSQEFNNTLTDTFWTIDDDYLNNVSNVLTFNEAKMNVTISALDSDTNLTEFDVEQYIFDDGIHCGNLTGNTSDLCTLTDTDTTYSHLSNFSDDIGVSADYDEVSDIPVANITDEDYTHFALVDDIYDWVIGLSYITNAVSDLVNYYTKTESELMNDTLTAEDVLLNARSDGLNFTGLSALNTRLTDAVLVDTGTMSDTNWCKYNLGTTDITCDVTPVTDTNTNCSASGNCATVYQGTNAVLDASDEANLDVNSSLVSYDVECSNCLSGTEISTDAFAGCGAGNVCGGGHTHPASQVTAGTFCAGDYVFQNELNATDALRGMTHFTVETINITCFDITCDFYMNASSGCTHYPNGFETCGS